MVLIVGIIEENIWMEHRESKCDELSFWIGYASMKESLILIFLFIFMKCLVLFSELLFETYICKQ